MDFVAKKSQCQLSDLLDATLLVRGDRIATYLPLLCWELEQCFFQLLIQILFLLVSFLHSLWPRVTRIFPGSEDLHLHSRKRGNPRLLTPSTLPAMRWKAKMRSIIIKSCLSYSGSVRLSNTFWVIQSPLNYSRGFKLFESFWIIKNSLNYQKFPGLSRTSWIIMNLFWIMKNSLNYEKLSGLSRTFWTIRSFLNYQKPSKLVSLNHQDILE